MVAYLVALGAGLGLAITSRVVFWADLRRAQRLRTDPRTGILALALFVFAISAALVVVGVIGVMHDAQAGQRSPVPLGVVWIVVTACFAALVVARQRRRHRLRKARDEARRRVRDAASAEPPSTE